MTEKRYSVSPGKSQEWIPVGDMNQFKFLMKDCYLGKAGNVVTGHREPVIVGRGKWLGSVAGGPMWGDSPTFIHTIEWEMNQ